MSMRPFVLAAWTAFVLVASAAGAQSPLVPTRPSLPPHTLLTPSATATNRPRIILPGPLIPGPNRPILPPGVTLEGTVDRTLATSLGATAGLWLGALAGWSLSNTSEDSGDVTYATAVVGSYVGAVAGCAAAGCSTTGALVGSAAGLVMGIGLWRATTDQPKRMDVGRGMLYAGTVGLIAALFDEVR